MDTVAVCVVGTGRAGLVHAGNLAERVPHARLAALCDTDAAALDAAGERFGVPARYTDFRDAFAAADIDAVVIVTPTFLHRDQACAAAEQGKHVFLEKPMAITTRECEDILAAAAAAGVKLQLGFMRRFDAGFLEAKTLLESGDLGRVMIVKSTGRGPGLPPPWVYDLDKSNGILAEVNSHDMDAIRWLVGSEIRRVYAEAANFKCADAQQEYPDFYDNVVVNLCFANGTLGVVDGTCPCDYGYDARVEVLCEKGVLFIGSIKDQGITQVTVDGRVTGRAVKGWRNLFKEAYVAEMAHFIACIREDKPPRVTGLDGLRAVEAVVAANKTLRTGVPEELLGEPGP